MNTAGGPEAEGDAGADPTSKGYIVDGRYRLLATLGQGAFGVVWEAEHVATRQPVALKIAHVRLVGDETALRRFEREAKALEVIDHPGVVSVIDVGMHEGRAFVAMERLHGRSMLDAFKDPTTTDEQRLDAIEDLLAPLAAAHRQGFVHRDLKPENVFLTEDGLRVLDFGLTKQAEACGVTHSGATLGTPQYMSPEQAADSKHVGPSADVWAIGVMLHQVFAQGALPFPGTNAGEILHALAHAAPQPLPEAVPPSWRALVAWCLERDPTDRPPDAVMLQYAFVHARQEPDGAGATFRERVRRLSGAPVDAFAPTGMMPEMAADAAADAGQGGAPAAAPLAALAAVAPAAPVAAAAFAAETPAPVASHPQATAELPIRRPGKGLVVLALLGAAAVSAAGMFFLFSHLDEEPAVPAAVETDSESEATAEAEPELVRVEIETTLEGTALFVDGTDRGALPAHAAIRLRPGEHVLEARRDGGVLAAATLVLSPGEDARLTLGGTEAETTVEHVAVPETERERRRTRPSGMEGALAVLPPVEASSPETTSPAPTTEARAEPSAMTEPAGVILNPFAEPTAEPATTTTTMTAEEPAPSPFVAQAMEPAREDIAVVDHHESMVATAPPRTAPPTDAQMRGVLQREIARVRRCVGDYDDELDVTATFQPDGSTRTRIGRGPSREARYCVQAALNEHARLPAFEGRRAAIRYTYEL